MPKSSSSNDISSPSNEHSEGDVVILYTKHRKKRKKKKDQEMSISNLRMLNIVPKSHT